MMSKIQGLCFYIILIFSLLAISSIYIIKTERKIKELQQENLIYKTNIEQAKLELKNNKKIIQFLSQKNKKIQKIELKKQNELNQENKKIKSLPTKKQAKIINVIFNNL